MLVLWWTSSESRANSFCVWLVLLYSAHLNQIQTNQSWGLEMLHRPYINSLTLLFHRLRCEACICSSHHYWCLTHSIRGKQLSIYFKTHDVFFLNYNEVYQLLLNTFIFPIYDAANVVAHSLFVQARTSFWVLLHHLKVSIMQRVKATLKSDDNIAITIWFWWKQNRAAFLLTGFWH